MKPQIPLLVALAAIATASVGVGAEPSAAGSEFAQPQRLVDIGGRKLNLHCSGSGSPTVVFEAPSGSAGWDWWAVQPRIAGRTRACVYDRAGFGFSERSPRPADARNALDDLHHLLQAARIGPPYVLVGNSFGGAVAQLFAWQYPDEVSGLVLAEPMQEDDDLRANEASHGKIAEFDAQVAAFRDACGAQADKGFAPKSDAWSQCVVGIDPSLPPAIGQVDLERRAAPPFWRTTRSERESFEADRAQLRAARQPFGDLPLIVLARGVSPYAIPGQPQSDANKAVEAANLALLTRLAQSSTQGEIRVVEGAGHVVQEDKPAAVADAVEDLVDRLNRR